MNINGEYRFQITINNMFHTYNFTMKEHNLITTIGLEFFASKITNDTKYEGWNIKKIITGESIITPQSDDDLDKKTKGEIFRNSREFTVQPYANDNKIMMTQRGVSGQKLNNTVDIGVVIEKETTVGEDTQIEQKLISRDTHSRINIPDTSIIEINYMFTLTSNTKDDCTEE